MFKSLTIRILLMPIRIFQYFIPWLILLVVASVGCSTTIRMTELLLTETHTVPVNITHPHSPPRLSLISELPGMLRLIGYSGGDFVTGTVEVSNDDCIPSIEKEHNSVNVVQRATTKLKDNQLLTNLWKLRVSDNRPFQLGIHNKNAEGHWNFSGLPIVDLYAELGTDKNAFTFDEVNPTNMQNCKLTCGTGDVTIEGILNAVCQNMVIQAGEGNLTLRFTGKELKQNLQVNIEANAGTINITIPQEIPARITATGDSKIIQGDNIIKVGDNTYETTSYHGFQGKNIEVLVAGSPGTIYLNSQSP